MIATCSRRYYGASVNSAPVRKMLPLGLVLLAMASPLLLIFGMSTYVGVMHASAAFSYPGLHIPLRMPAQPVRANASPPPFEATPYDCPPYGECPRVTIAVRKQDSLAFHRHLQLAALNRGGTYAYDWQGDAFDTATYTIRLPEDAAYELMNLHISSFASFTRNPVSPGYQQWATRWSGESSTLSSDLATLRVIVRSVERSDYYWGSVALFSGLGGVIAIFFGIATLLRRAKF